MKDLRSPGRNRTRVLKPTVWRFISELSNLLRTELLCAYGKRIRTSIDEIKYMLSTTVTCYPDLVAPVPPRAPHEVLLRYVSLAAHRRA
jgi:hypothetical protein